MQKVPVIGNILIFIGIGLLALIFAPAIKEEVKYNLNRITNVNEKPLTPPNKDFSIVIPKIGATAAVVANVDSQSPDSYLKALRKGVAHAAGTSYPGNEGNVYLFAHSTDTFYNVGRYNAVFYLIGKLQTGDEIDVFYKGKLIKYEVSEKKVVDPKDVKYLGKIDDGNTLTLQTCYPPGTTLKRLVVVAKEAKD